jgi:hypothetical protein
MPTCVVDALRFGVNVLPAAGIGAADPRMADVGSRPEK